LSILLNKKHIKVEEVLPYTQSSIHSVRAVMKQPLVILKYKGDRYYITGRKLLWSLLDRTFGPQYPRHEVLDSIYHGPIDDFKYWLSLAIKHMKDDGLIIDLCSREQFETRYGMSAMWCVDGMCGKEHKIVSDITLPTEEAHLLHILAVLKDYDVPMNYDGISDRKSSKRGIAVVHEFSEQKHELVTMRMRIIVSERGTASIEAWVEGDEWEASPFSELKYALEFDPRYFGPTLKRHYEELSNASASCSKNPQIAKASWLRMKDKLQRRKEEGDYIGRQTMMRYRHSTLGDFDGE
jgi:hypothetical protein